GRNLGFGGQFRHQPGDHTRRDFDASHGTSPDAVAYTNSCPPIWTCQSFTAAVPSPLVGFSLSTDLQQVPGEPFDVKRRLAQFVKRPVELEHKLEVDELVRRRPGRPRALIDRLGDEQHVFVVRGTRAY